MHILLNCVYKGVDCVCTLSGTSDIPQQQGVFLQSYNSVCIVHSCCSAAGQVYLLTSLCFTGSM